MSCNVISNYVDFVSKNLDIYTKKIMGKYYDNELVNKYIDAYVSVRYYNRKVSVRTTLEANINHYLNEVYSKNNNKTSRFILELFKMYYYLDGVKKFNFDKNLNKFSKELNDIRETKLGIVDKDFISKFSNLVIDNKKKEEKYINSFDSRDFYLVINDIRGKNVSDVEVVSNVSIPKLYSSYAINKVWNSTIIAENSLQVCYYLLNQMILKDIIDGDNSSKYIVPFRCSLFSKKDKIKRVLEIMNNDIAKDLISLKISFGDFINYKDDVYRLIKEGYQFSVILDDVFLKSRDNNILDNFSYIIINDDKYRNSKLIGKKNIIMM